MRSLKESFMMRRTVVLMSAVAVGLASVGVFAQARPNFAGKWAMVQDPNAAPSGGGRGGGFGGLGQGGTVAQDDKTLTITTTTQAGEVKRTYNLDGSDSKNTLNIGGNAIEQVSKARWDGSRLVIATTTDFGGTPAESTMTLSLDASGNLVVDTTGGRGGPTKMTYKKG